MHYQVPAEDGELTECPVVAGVQGAVRVLEDRGGHQGLLTAQPQLLAQVRRALASRTQESRVLVRALPNLRGAAPRLVHDGLSCRRRAGNGSGGGGGEGGNAQGKHGGDG
ncbi:hypothetical protein Slala05_67700 [Streptomyces lavendulae subsp. lavendulae]|nr:hypothetical protein Slala05_67700 [Streptomyces lavendulae subsp. lavendulae]